MCTTLTTEHAQPQLPTYLLIVYSLPNCSLTHVLTHLDEEHAQLQHAWQPVAVEVALDVWDARSSRLGRKVGQGRRHRHEAAAGGHQSQPAKQ